MGEYILGIDGGGTRTAFMLVDIERDRVYESTAEACCHFHHGMDGFDRVISEGVGTLLSEAQVGPADVVAVCAGISSFGESKKYDELIRGTIEAKFHTENVMVVNDLEVSLAGSLELEPGIAVVSGTGSMAIGKDRNGRMERCGGWGELIGDEGSGYWLGKRTLELFSKQADGRSKKGALYPYVKETLRLENDLDLIEYVYTELGDKRERIASLSKLLYEAALLGDAEAVDSFERAAGELFLMIKAVAGKLDFDEGMNISYSGGVFNAGRFMLDPLKEMLSELNARLIEPRLSPLAGAVLLAGARVCCRRQLISLLRQHEKGRIGERQ